MKVWITKYALTQGILEKEAEVCSERMIKVKGIPGKTYDDYIHKPHWHESFEEALVNAETMRSKKIASLKKQIHRLNQITFAESVPEGE